MSETMIRTEVDGLLEQIGDLQSLQARIQEDAAREIASVKARYAKEADIAAGNIRSCETKLKRLAREHKAALMGEADRVDLAHGAVLFAIERRVKRVRGMLERLKQRGFDFCIRTAESVDWAAVEELQDDTLEGLGTQWVEKERFSYEVRD